jgi:hypothetical protein
LNATLGHSSLNYVRHLGGAKDLVKMKVGFLKEEKQSFTGEFLIMIKVLKSGFIKKKVKSYLVSSTPKYVRVDILLYSVTA